MTEINGQTCKKTFGPYLGSIDASDRKWEKELSLLIFKKAALEYPKQGFHNKRAGSPKYMLITQYKIEREIKPFIKCTKS